MAKKKIYEKLQGEGATTTLSPVIQKMGSSTYEEDGLITCPYTNYIPLSYVLKTNNISYTTTIGDRFLTNELKISNPGKKLGNTILEKWMRASWREDTRPENLKRLTDNINDYLLSDEIDNINYNSFNNYTRYRREDVISGFDSYASKIDQRSYTGVITPYSLYLNRPGHPYVCDPHVLAVVLPENYIYMKYNLLVNSVIDLSRVIILINSELHTTTFPNKPFKAMYKEVLPQIMKTNCDIWKVPLNFIRENCFLSRLELQSVNIFERRKEIKALVENFYKSEKGRVKNLLTLEDEMLEHVERASGIYDSTEYSGRQSERGGILADSYYFQYATSAMQSITIESATLPF